MSTPAHQRVTGSVIIPAHNEARTIGRLLNRVTPAKDLEVVVACNGCVDTTADVARTSGAHVIELQQPSKAAAMIAADAVATTFPRAYVDADVEISADDLRLLFAAVTGGSVHAAGPSRHLPMDGVTPIVRWYYDVWRRLPQVDEELFGRGVVVLSREGHARIRSLPSIMADDLAMAEAFEPHERRVVRSARATIRPPRTVRDLLRRRSRVATSNVEADMAQLRRTTSRTSLRTLAGVAARSPRVAPKVPVFVGVTLLAKLAARPAVRAGDFMTWMRDESSRA